MQMPVDQSKYLEIIDELKAKNVTLVAVSKTKPVDEILALYELGQRDFGENYVQELTAKAEQLPKDIRWHFIGHLQTNKVKYIAPFIHLVHVADSLKLLGEIDRQAAKNNRRVDCLLQMHIAKEETKFGMDEPELGEALDSLARQPLSHTRIRGLMGMASFTEDKGIVRREFRYLRSVFDKQNESRPGLELTILSMGMSGDYQIAVEEGSNLVRIGSLLFGARG